MACNSPTARVIIILKVYILVCLNAIPKVKTSWLWLAALSLKKQIKLNFKFIALSEYLGQKVMTNGSF
jgi:hypothetical protein